MTQEFDKKELLSKVIDSIVNNDIETANQVFSQYSTQKSSEILSAEAAPAETITEGSGSPIRLKGDDVFVNNKLVGHIDAQDGSIEFTTSGDDAETHSFADMDKFYDYLTSNFVK